MGVLVLMLCCFLNLLSCGLPSVNTNEYVDPDYLDMLLETEQYDEFCKLLQIDDVGLVRPVKGNRTQDPNFQKGMEHGDILFRAPQLRSAINFLRFPGSKWEKHEVQYIISTSGYTSQQRMQIERAIADWNKKISQIKFKRRRTSRDYVMFFNGNGCYSNIGRVGGSQVISIQARGCMSLGTIQHEMMHAIGFAHEHNRADRDEYVKVLEKNIPPGWRSQYEKTTSEIFEDLGEYDYYSVMHYNLTAPESGKPAFEILKENVDISRIGQQDNLTQSDISKINMLYSYN